MGLQPHAHRQHLLVTQFAEGQVVNVHTGNLHPAYVDGVDVFKALAVARPVAVVIVGVGAAHRFQSFDLKVVLTALGEEELAMSDEDGIGAVVTSNKQSLGRSRKLGRVQLFGSREKGSCEGHANKWRCEPGEFTLLEL